MPICPRCRLEMTAQGGKMVCPCGYQYDVARRLPSYDELKQELGEYRLFIEDNDLGRDFEVWKDARKLEGR